MSARFVIGDVHEVLATLPDASVDLVMSSPPFLALRSYLPADHADKDKEIGSEPTPGAFLDTLLDVVEECARVLTPHGSLVFELGDTYTTNAGPNSQTAWAGDPMGGHGPGTTRPYRTRSRGWPLDKSLCMIPSSFAWALSWGRNPWTGRETEPWRVRNLVAWCRPNPPVGALGDKFRPGTSYLTVACKSRARWFDLDAVREAPKAPPQRFLTPKGYSRGGEGNEGDGRALVPEPGNECNPAGAPPLDWWEIPTQPYSGSHYATFPEKLVVRPIESMCPRFVCRTCGEPRRRLTETTQADTGRTTNGSKPRDRAESYAGTTYETRTLAEVTTLGWSDCGHDDYRRGVTLDPFCGSGTTLAVAEGLARDSIGIDLDARNADLAEKRVGMFLTVETHAAPPARGIATGPSL